MDLKQYLDTRRKQVDTALESFLPAETGSLAEHMKAMRYSLFAGGKRVRPILCLAAAESVRSYDNSFPEELLLTACALECIHTYSLIHDDLPALDDDDLRRGRPTLHRREGEAQALLAGDLLLAEAFRQLARTPLGPRMVSRMLGMLAEAAGPGFLVGGQYMDMHHPPEPDMPWIESMIQGKTAAMIRVSLELGTLAGGFDEDILTLVSSAQGRPGQPSFAIQAQPEMAGLLHTRR